MRPRLVSSTKILTKTLSSGNSSSFVTDFPTGLESEPVDVLPKIKAAQSYNIFVSTWNVGGVAPTGDLNIDDLLDTQNTYCDIYVLGFQEVVPLTTTNVLGLEKKKVSKKWNSLIRKTLNKKSRMCSKVTKPNEESSDLKNEFRRLISKRMVGLLISVWVSGDLYKLVQNANVSCVGCGIMGRLGNKGSVSVRFKLRDTSFCFVCSHLASGGEDGDEHIRNSNAIEIFSRTSFPTTDVRSSVHLPKRILDHDQVVLFGDLNYRISLPNKETRSLVNRNDWNTLIKYDQLRSELIDGQFRAWNEGAINFAPTYKYFPNSDEYFGKNYETKRAPAWCDRIIWTGGDLKQILYNRSESELSDHRPVTAVFSTRC